MDSLPSKRIRVLIVDDSAIVRRLVSQALSLQTDMEVAATVEDGPIALDRLALDRPDVVVLDLEMPRMGGIEVLREIKKRHPGLPVLVFSSHTSQAANATVDALLAGADEYVTKPSSVSLEGGSWLATQNELALKLRSVTRRFRRLGSNQSLETLTDSLNQRARGHAPLRAIAIGTSSGGPQALGALLPRLAPKLRVPLFIVQHMPRSFTAALAGRLSDKSKLRVVEATHGQVAEPGVAYLAPGDFHMQVSSRLGKPALLLDEGPLRNGCRPSVDPLFCSAAETYGNGLLAIVLTGIGCDGVAGAQKVASSGGHVWVQDEQSAAVWGMPGAVVRAGLARRTVSLDAMPSAIMTAVAEGLPQQQPLDRQAR